MSMKYIVSAHGSYSNASDLESLRQQVACHLACDPGDVLVVNSVDVFAFEAAEVAPGKEGPPLTKPMPLTPLEKDLLTNPHTTADDRKRLHERARGTFHAAPLTPGEKEMLADPTVLPQVKEALRRREWEVAHAKEEEDTKKHPTHHLATETHATPETVPAKPPTRVTK